MKICFTELIMEVSHALDYVEAELLGVQTNHSKRVAYLCAYLGRQLGISNRKLLDLVGCAALHDNALTEYIQIEYLSTQEFITDIRTPKLGIHCTMGERNIQGFPFYGNVKNVILYHHENADGSGPFSKKEGQISFFSSLIHLADQLDTEFGLKVMDVDKWDAIQQFVSAQEGKLFGSKETGLFKEFITMDILERLADGRVEEELKSLLTFEKQEYSLEQIISIGGIFARIVDYKSTFTSLHSMGIAHKAYTMASHYDLPEETKAKLYLAGALHDIGKLAVDVNILEKPGRLTDGEFEEMKGHALITYKILSNIHGMEDVCRWASCHHEKLNGKGYPFGYNGEQLGRFERLMACLDIYQALREDRPYKKGNSHNEAMKIMNSMVEEGMIDRTMTRDIDQVFAGVKEDSVSRLSYAAESARTAAREAASGVENDS